MAVIHYLDPQCDLTLALSLLLGGCSLLASKPQPPVPQRLQGTLWFNTTQAQLLPCDAAEPLALDVPPALQSTLALCDSAACFADLELHADNAPAQLVRLHRLEAESHGCQDQTFAHLQLAAFGNEPFWSLRLNDQGLVLQQPGEPTLALPYIREQLADGLHYISSHADHQQLGLWISQQPCTDSMSGFWYGLSARLEWQGQTLSGCAYYGAQYSSAP